MKEVFRIDVVGDAEVLLDGDITDSITFFFRSFDRKRMIEMLDSVIVESMVVSSMNPKKNDKYVKLMKKAIKDAKNFIEHNSMIGFMKDFGGNQHVRIEKMVIPTEEDFSD